ncbi:hypothetical protein MKW92_017585, partial [Papaver armeniacum]
DSFMASINEETTSESSSIGASSYPPGFEPLTYETSDDTDATSTDQDTAESQQVVPKKLKTEWKRLGVTVVDISSPVTKRVVKTRGQFGSL